jgi:adenine-specific DNA-methyltransferase
MKKDLTVLRRHEKNESWYGELYIEDLVESLPQAGLRDPIKVKPDGTILDGHRRWKAAKELGWNEIETEVLIQGEDYEDEEQYMLDANLTRQKTFKERMRMAQDQRELYEKRARERKKQGQEVVEGEKGTTYEKLAKRFFHDKSREWYRKAEKVWLKSEDGQEKAQELVEKINDGEIGATTAYEILKDEERESNADLNRPRLTEQSRSLLLERLGHKTDGRTEALEEKIKESDKDVEELSQELKVPEAVVWNYRLKGKKDLEKIRNFTRNPEHSNLWNFKQDIGFGEKDYPGDTNGKILLNLLRKYTEEGDLVVDPFAGGGTTADACLLMNRNCRLFDIAPEHGVTDDRPEIEQNDSIEEIPVEDADFIFLDPPYADQMKEGYSDKDGEMAQMSIKKFKKSTEKLVENCRDALKEDGKVAVFISDYRNNHEVHFLPRDFEEKFRERGFDLAMRFAVPYTVDHKHGGNLRKQAIEHNYFRVGFRDLLVLRKNDTKGESTLTNSNTATDQDENSKSKIENEAR